MSDPKQFLIYGDLNVVPGVDASSGPGSVIISGINSLFTVEGQTQLDQTSIDTTDGQFSVVGTNKVAFTPSSAIEFTASANSFFNVSTGDLTLGSTAGNVVVNTGTGFDVNASTSVTLDSNAASYFRVTGGANLTLDGTTGRVITTSASADSNALTLSATNASGGVSIASGTGGITALATDGPFSISGQNTASSLNLSTSLAAQDLSINLTGSTDSSIVLNSSGTGSDAIRLNTTAGAIDVNSFSAVTIDSAGTSNFTVTGAFDLSLGSTSGSVLVSGGEAVVDAVAITASNAAGGIALTSGTGGASVDTTGGFSIDGVLASNVTVTGTAPLTVNNVGGQLVLQSTQAAVDAVRIYASNATAGIDIDSGSGGINATSQGTVSLNASGAASNFSLLTSGPEQDLTIALTGAFDSSLILSSSGTGNDAIKVNATAGGIDIDSTGPINIDTTNTADGIKIATLNTIPVTIGSANSTTTIAGDLVVSGTNTTINTETLTVQDNVIVINSGSGELGADGGILIHRFQAPNNDGSGDVVQDIGTGKVDGVFQAGSTAPGTLVLGTGASGVDDFYNGWWIKFISNAVTYVRRIKDYVGSSKTATIFVTTEADGLDLVDVPVLNDTYSLYNSPFISTFYKESNDRWNIAYTALTPDAISETGASVFTIQRYAPMDVGNITIKSNGVPGGSTLNVDVINETTADAGVTVEGVFIKDGLIGGSVPDSTEVINLIDNSTTGVEITSTSTSGSYMLLVTAVQTGNLLAVQGNGSHATFVSSSSGVGGASSRLSGTKGNGNERIDIEWNTGEKIKLKHAPGKSAGTGALVPYRVKVIRVL